MVAATTLLWTHHCRHVGAHLAGIDAPWTLALKAPLLPGLALALGRRLDGVDVADRDLSHLSQR